MFEGACPSVSSLVHNNFLTQKVKKSRWPYSGLTCTREDAARGRKFLSWFNHVNFWFVCPVLFLILKSAGVVEARMRKSASFLLPFHVGISNLFWHSMWESHHTFKPTLGFENWSYNYHEGGCLCWTTVNSSEQECCSIAKRVGKKPACCRSLMVRRIVKSSWRSWQMNCLFTFL